MPKKCTPGNKPCGDSCIPEGHKCSKGKTTTQKDSKKGQPNSTRVTRKFDPIQGKFQEIIEKIQSPRNL